MLEDELGYVQLYKGHYTRTAVTVLTMRDFHANSEFAVENSRLQKCKTVFEKYRKYTFNYIVAVV